MGIHSEQFRLFTLFKLPSFMDHKDTTHTKKSVKQDLKGELYIVVNYPGSHKKSLAESQSI